MKKFVVYILGIVTGVILTIGVLCFLGSTDSNISPENDPGITLFNEPGDNLGFRSFEVMQVLANGSALAHASDKINEQFFFNGTLVLLMPDENNSYYDDQILKTPSGKITRQIGTYRYETKDKLVKTVPVVGYFEK